MENMLKRNIRNSELAVAKEKRAFLVYPANGLMPCKLEETEDSVCFVFDIKGVEPSDTVLDKPKWEQMRFLLNTAELADLDAEYDFSLSLDNQYIDINLMPKLLIRDAKRPGSASFLQRYKALIGCVLLRKYSYEDYLNGGDGLYKKNKLLSQLTALESLDEIKDSLQKEYRRLMWETRETEILVPKRNMWFSRVAIPILLLALVVCAFYVIRFSQVDIPFRNSVIAANTAYINGDPLSVQRILRSYDLSRLSVETRYFLARSYVSTEALTDAQRENILIGLAPITNPLLFDYWILLGRLYFNEAVEIAQRLGDDELLLYAYLKQEVFVRSDFSIPGEERAALLSKLERNINSLNQARDDAVREVFETNP